MNQEILQAYLRQEETPAYIFDLDMFKIQSSDDENDTGRTDRNLFCNESQPISDRTVKGYGRQIRGMFPGRISHL